MAVISTPPIWQQNRAYSARLDRQFADVFFGEGVIDVASGDFEVTQTSPLTNSVLVNTGRAVIQGDDEANQGKYLILSETVLNVVLNAAPPADARIDLVCLRVNDPVAGGPAGNNAEVIVVDGVQSSSPVAPALPDTAIPLAEVLRTAGDTSITNSMITDVRGQALIVPGTALTANGDLLTRNAGSAVAIPVGSAGLPLLAGSPIPGYGQVNTAGIADGAVTAIKLGADAQKVRQFLSTSAATVYTVSNATSVMSALTVSITPTSAPRSLILSVVMQVNAYSTGASTDDRVATVELVRLDPPNPPVQLSFRTVGRYLTAASTATAASASTVVSQVVIPAGSTSARSYSVRIGAAANVTAAGNLYGGIISVMEIAP